MESRFVRRWREGGDGGGVLHEERASRGQEKMPKKLDLGNSKVTLRKANGEATLQAEAKKPYVGGGSLKIKMSST